MQNRLDILKLEYSNDNVLEFEDALKHKDDSRMQFKWKCVKFGDEWEASMYNRLVRGRDCHYCQNHRVNTRNCLASTHPHLVSEWSRDNAKSPSEVVAGSTDKVTWECTKLKHKWEAQINSRARIKPTGCPYCAHKLASKEYNLETEYPEIAKDYDEFVNKNTAQDILPGSKAKVGWVCHVCQFKWENEVRKRTSNREGCPQCRDKTATLKNCLASTHLDLIINEWDFEKNNLNPFKYTAKNLSSTELHWICPIGHKYHSILYNRIKKNKPTGCPYCKNIITSPEKSVASDKLLSEEWDAEANIKKGYSIEKVSLKSSKQINWICSNPTCGFCWIATPANRTGVNKTGCPQCSTRRNKQGTSKAEAEIRKLLQMYFSQIPDSPYKISGLKFRNSIPSIDIWIPEIHLGLEYDPFHTHKNSLQKDIEKTEFLKANGHPVIRIRQTGLTQISESDVYYDERNSVEDIVIAVLQKILDLKEGVLNRIITGKIKKGILALSKK